MLIRYTGPKPQKTVTWFGRQFVFDPTRELPELEHADLIKWLLHPDRAGLFVQGQGAATKASKPAATESAAAPKKRGRARKKG